jgi:hypothetical protein
MKRIPLYQYVALNNPSGGGDVIEHFDLPRPQTREGIARGLRHVMINFKEEGLKEIAKAHPDRKLILETQDVVEEVPNPTILDEKSSACGCSSNANGDNQTSPNNAPNQELIDDIKELKLKEKFKAEYGANEKTDSITKDDISSEVKKVLANHKPFIKDTLPYLAIGGIGMILFYSAIKGK